MITCPNATVDLPPALAPGQRIAVFAPSAAGASRFPVRLARGVAALSRALGREVFVPVDIEVPRHRLAGPATHRARLFDRLVADPGVGAIFTTYGGFNSNEILRHIDWAALRASPKLLVGYSDTTALLLAAHARAGLASLYGPAVLPQFGEVPEPFGYTVASLRRAVVDGVGGDVPSPAVWYQEASDWAVGETVRTPLSASSARCVRAGVGNGIFFGGNISTINFLAGTPFLAPPTDATILFIEMVNNEASWVSVRRSLAHFRDFGMFDHVAGLLVGRSPETGTAAELDELLLEMLDDFDFPIIADAPFGHFDPIATLPIGVAGRIEAVPSACRIEITSPLLARP